MKRLLVLILFVLVPALTAAPAKVTLNSLNPSSGQIGSAVTLSGSGFSATASANKVSFSASSGSVNAVVISASAKALIVTVPNGAVSGKVFVQVSNATSNGVQFAVTSPTITPPSIDAPLPKVIALPVRDVTLFGHASDPNGLPLTVEWRPTSGPAPVKFSAPNALATTASFTMPGVYGFDLVATNGASTVTRSTTVQVLSAESQAAYYVDPTYIGGSSDGSAAHPWTTLDLPYTSPQWVSINRSLASNNVIIYFSARTAAFDAPESVNAEVNLWRTDGSKNRLTLDGMSKYNANDAAGAWSDYTGNSRFTFNLVTPHSLAIGVQSTSIGFPTHYTTIRGFDVTGAGARVLVAGNDVTVEYVRSHDVTATDPTFALQNAVHGDCTVEFGNLTGITFRNNTITNGVGEGFYVGGNYRTTANGGCPTWGNAHSDVLLESNVIISPGFNGGQGDAIDLKAGLKNVTVRGNTISGVPHGVGAYAIVSLGTFDYLTTNANYLIEQNTIIDGEGMLFQFQNGTIVRNNVVRDGLIYFSGNASDRNLKLSLYNNTMYGKSAVYPTTGGFAFGGVDSAVVKNNLFAGLGNGDVQISVNDSNSFVTSDFNFFVSGASIDNRYTLGASDKTMAQGTAYFIDALANDFHLNSTSPAVAAGIDLTSMGFWNDLEGQTRTGAAWDAGAFKKK